MIAKKPSEALPKGWKVALERTENNEPAVVAESPSGERATGEEEIQRLAHKECKSISQQQIIMRHLKYSLERLERLKIPAPLPTKTMTSVSAPEPHSSNEKKRLSGSVPEPTKRLKIEDSFPAPDLWSSGADRTSQRAEYLKWLKILQFNQNILCYGVGSKYHILQNFAKTVLHDEDVLELTASYEESPPTELSPSPLFSTGSLRKRSGEETLWSLFQMIRQAILTSSRIPPNSLWSHKSDGSSYPLHSEAQLISDFLCLHYGWHKTGMARATSNRRQIIRNTILRDTSSTSVPANLEADHPPLQLSTRTLSRETAKLLEGRQSSNSMNWDYVNSVSRLYILIHNIEDVLLTSSHNSSRLYRAFAILASCPVVSIIASVTSLNTPLYLGWDSAHLNSFHWAYQHTPSPVPHEPLPEVVTAFSNESRKASSDRADTLKYILKSLTKKHHEVLKYLLGMTESAGPGPTSSNSTSSSPPSSVGWLTLLSYAMSQFIVKGDSDLRQLVSELKDQRIVRTYSDQADAKVYVALVLSPVERDSAVEYYQQDKKIGATKRSKS